MLTILLKILSILGILLLVLLAVVLFLVLAVLFVPIAYRIRGVRSAASDGNGMIMLASVKADWLLGVLRFRYTYPDPGEGIVKFLFFTIYRSGSAEEEADGSKTSQKLKKKKQKKVPDTDQERQKCDKGQETCSECEKDHTANQDASEKKGFIEKIQYTFHKTYDKIKNIRENIAYYKEVLSCDDTKGLLNHAFGRLGRIWKSIRPRKLRADIRFGTGSPDTTGYAYGIYGILCSHLGKHVLLTPDFEQAVLEGKVYAAGHITVMKLLWNILPVVFDSRLKELMGKFSKE